MSETPQKKSYTEDVIPLVVCFGYLLGLAGLHCTAFMGG